MEAMTGAAVGGFLGLLMVAIVGLVIAVVAKLLMPAPNPGGWFVNILLGIAGSWVGGFLFGLLGLFALCGKGCCGLGCCTQAVGHRRKFTTP